ncbi:MAG: hypothetical protein WD042_07095 [Phycisphaeraceae bacterium]
MRTLAVLSIAAIFGLLAGCGDSSTVGGGGAGTLTLDQPSTVSLMQGGTAEVTITIKRENLQGPVTVSFSKLPAGVSVVDGDKKIVGESGAYNLKASDTADVVSAHEAQVTATASTGIAVTQALKVDVTAKSAP